MTKWTTMLIMGVLPAQVWGAVYGITALSPSGVNLTGVQNVTQLTANSISYSAAQLIVPTSAADTSGLNASFSASHPSNVSGYLSEQAIMDLDLGTADLGVGGGAGRWMAAWFPIPIQPDGDNNTSELFVIEWSGPTPGEGRDRFLVQLLTSGPGSGGSPTIAATVQVLAADYTQVTTTTIDTILGGSGDKQTVGGVGISIDGLVAPNTMILGVRIPSDDGAGGLSGVDPVIIAGVPEPASVLLVLGVFLPMLAARRRRRG